MCSAGFSCAGARAFGARAQTVVERACTCCARTTQFIHYIMSGKSALKNKIFRNAPFSTALSLIDTRSTPVYEGWDAATNEEGGHAAHNTVKCVFEDASVRFAAGAFASLDGNTGVDVLHAFLAPIERVFAHCPHVHTYVLSFDKKCFVPKNKGATQQKRRDTLGASLSAKGVDEWRWDGVSPIVALDRVLPPWKRLRLDARAYKRAVHEIAQLVCANAYPPARKRIIVDYDYSSDDNGVVEAMAPFVIEASVHGIVLEVYRDHSLANAQGEADLSAQFYAHIFTRRCSPDPVRATPLRSRRREANNEAHYNAFYGAHTTQARAEHFFPPNSASQALYLRTLYEAGAVMLRSVDTDFLPLSLACYMRDAVEPSYKRTWPENSDDDDDESECNSLAEHLALHPDYWQEMHSASAHKQRENCAFPVYLCMGQAYQANGAFSTRNAPNAQGYHEIYNVEKLVDIVHKLYGVNTALNTTSREEAVWSFVVYCTACGNDYVTKPYGLSHQCMYEAYAWMASRGQTLVDVCARTRKPSLKWCAFIDFIALSYARKMKLWSGLVSDETCSHTNRPSYAELAHMTKTRYTKKEAHMFNEQELYVYANSIVWCLLYTWHGHDNFEKA